MKEYMPQEIQVWYILPALRREFAKCFVNDFGLSQKKAAELLSVTEAAISQYFGSKRAKEVRFIPEIIEEIRDSCKSVLEGDSEVSEDMYRISISDGVKRSMCTIHKKHDPTVEESCRMCFLHQEEW